MNPFVEGFILQASLILALGAQNLFVLESGLKKRRHLVVAFVCSVCDAILIAVGVAGAATIFVKNPYLKTGFSLLGVFFLAYYGLKKLREGFQGIAETHAAVTTSSSLNTVILLALGFSLLNPHVYLDTIILIGGYSAQFSDLVRRVQFGAGAASFSVIWFFGLALCANYLSAFLSGPKAMRFICLASGGILIGLSLKLGQDIYKWIIEYGLFR